MEKSLAQRRLYWIFVKNSNREYFWNGTHPDKSQNRSCQCIHTISFQKLWAKAGGKEYELSYEGQIDNTLLYIIKLWNILYHEMTRATKRK